MSQQQIATFDRSAASAISAAAMAALEKVAAEHGLTVRRGNGTFNPTDFSLKVTFKVTGEDGAPVEPADFKVRARALDLPADCFGKEVEIRGETFRIDGINSRARRAPVLGTRLRDGKRFKLDVWSVKLMLDAKAAAPRREEA